MKKSLVLLLPIMLVLASCNPGTSSVVSSSASSTPVSSTPTSSSTSLVIPKVVPTLQVTIGSITGYDAIRDENTLYIAGPKANIPDGTSTDGVWAYKAMTLNAETKTYDYTFPETEAETSLEYKVYIDHASGFNWTYPCTDNASASSFLDVVAGQTAYAVTKSFTGQPDSSKTVDVTVNITPTIAGATVSSLNDGVVIWIWDSKDSATVALAASTVGTQQVFSRTISACEQGTLRITATLGNASSADWGYKSSDIADKDYTIAETTTSLDITADFASQPTYGGTLSCVITLVATDVPTGVTPKIILNDNWLDMTAGATNKWTYTASSLSAGAVESFSFYYWASSTDEGHLYATYTDASTYTNFSITMASADVAKTVTGTFASHVGTIDDTPVTTTYSVAITLNIATGGIESGYAPKAEWGGWTNYQMTEVTAASQYTYTIEGVEAGTYALFFYYWGTADHYLGSAATGNTESTITKWSIAVSADTALVFNDADFVTAHTATLAA
jgi:hypothetical protein